MKNALKVLILSNVLLLIFNTPIFLLAKKFSIYILFIQFIPTYLIYRYIYNKYYQPHYSEIRPLLKNKGAILVFVILSALIIFLDYQHIVN